MTRGVSGPLGDRPGDQGPAPAAHEFELGGQRYRCNALEPLEQVHVARRLAPIILAALKPEDGRKAILARLMKLANLAGAQGQQPATTVDSDQVVSDALDLATSILSAAAAADEQMVDAIIRKVMLKIFRLNDRGGSMVMWDTRPGHDRPTHRDVDGFLILSLVARYLVHEFRGTITAYIAGLGLKPGPALMAAAGMSQRPPGAPGTI